MLFVIWTFEFYLEIAHTAGLQCWRRAELNSNGNKHLESHPIPP